MDCSLGVVWHSIKLVLLKKFPSCYVKSFLVAVDLFVRFTPIKLVSSQKQIYSKYFQVPGYAEHVREVRPTSYASIAWTVLLGVQNQRIKYWLNWKSPTRHEHTGIIEKAWISPHREWVAALEPWALWLVNLFSKPPSLLLFFHTLSQVFGGFEVARLESAQGAIANDCIF